MTTILGISGSLRKASLNAALLRAAADLMPAGTTLDANGIEGIPLHNGDEESARGIPPAVAELKRKLLDADGLLLVTPEYNNSIPGVFKNAIDWMSRPAERDSTTASRAQSASASGKLHETGQKP